MGSCLHEIYLIGDGLFEITFSVHDSEEVVRLLSQYGEFIKEIKLEGAYERVKEIWKKGLKAS